MQLVPATADGSSGVWDNFGAFRCVLFVSQLVFAMIFSCTLFQNFSAKQRWGTLEKTQPLLPGITTSECHVAKHISFLGYFWGRNRLPCYFFSFAAVPARISNGHYEYLWIHTLDTWRTLQPILRTWAFSLSNSTSTASYQKMREPHKESFLQNLTKSMMFSSTLKHIIITRMHWLYC